MHTVADQMHVLAPGLLAHHTHGLHAPGLGHAAALMFRNDTPMESVFTVVLIIVVVGAVAMALSKPFRSN